MRKQTADSVDIYTKVEVVAHRHGDSDQYRDDIPVVDDKAPTIASYVLRCISDKAYAYTATVTKTAAYYEDGERKEIVQTFVWPKKLINARVTTRKDQQPTSVGRAFAQRLASLGFGFTETAVIDRTGVITKHVKGQGYTEIR
jgi:hypothetical protein